MLAESGGRAVWRSGRWLHAWLGVVRRIAGMPDYAAYADHLRCHHPGTPVPSEREFFEQFLRARSGGGPARCC